MGCITPILSPELTILCFFLLHRALKTWVRNNRQNGYEFKPDSLSMNDYYEPSNPKKNKIIDMGIIQLPVCTLEHANYRWGMKTGEFFPC